MTDRQFRPQELDLEPRREGVDPDLAAVRDAQRDTAAFDLLYRRHVADVYTYAFYQLGDHHDAEDATARTFVAALRAISRFDDRGASFRAWLFRIAHNTVFNTRRSRLRRATTPIDTAPMPAAADSDPASLVSRADELRRVQRAIAALPDDRRQVVLLRFVEGLSAREIGAVLDRSPGAVRVLLHRALRELAERLTA
jgi:RNA polymerase sigma-70 factor (ECF subfamily)